MKKPPPSIHFLSLAPLGPFPSWKASWPHGIASKGPLAQTAKGGPLTQSYNLGLDDIAILEQLRTVRNGSLSEHVRGFTVVCLFHPDQPLILRSSFLPQELRGYTKSPVAAERQLAASGIGSLMSYAKALRRLKVSISPLFINSFGTLTSHLNSPKRLPE